MCHMFVMINERTNKKTYNLFIFCKQFPIITYNSLQLIFKMVKNCETTKFLLKDVNNTAARPDTNSTLFASLCCL